MVNISEGQCGRCAYFGENHPDEPKLVQIRISGEAPEGYVDDCGHPSHESLHLKVTANSGCTGFKPAA